MNSLRSPASPPGLVAFALIAAFALHGGAAFLVLMAPGIKVVQPPIPMEVRFVAEAPPVAASQPAPQPVPPPAPEPRPPAPKPPERKPEPRPIVRKPAPPQKAPRQPPALVSESPRAAPEAPVAALEPTPRDPAPVPAPPAAPIPPVPAAAAAPVASSAPPAVSAPRFDAAYLANPPPAYPMISRRLGEEGRVLLRVHVEPDGRASSVEVRDSSGFGRLDDAALRAVRGWRFVPAKRGDQSIAAWVLVPINFTLKNS